MIDFISFSFDVISLLIATRWRRAHLPAQVWRRVLEVGAFDRSVAGVALLMLRRQTPLPEPVWDHLLRPDKAVAGRLAAQFHADEAIDWHVKSPEGILRNIEVWASTFRSPDSPPRLGIGMRTDWPKVLALTELVMLADTCDHAFGLRYADGELLGGVFYGPPAHAPHSPLSDWIWHAVDHESILRSSSTR